MLYIYNDKKNEFFNQFMVYKIRSRMFKHQEWLVNMSINTYETFIKYIKIKTINKFVNTKHLFIAF